MKIECNCDHLITRERFRLDVKEDSLMVKTEGNCSEVEQRLHRLRFPRISSTNAGDSGVAAPALQERNGQLQQHAILHRPPGRISFSPRETLKRGSETYRVPHVWKVCRYSPDLRCCYRDNPCMQTRVKNKCSN